MKPSRFTVWMILSAALVVVLAAACTAEVAPLQDIPDRQMPAPSPQQSPLVSPTITAEPSPTQKEAPTDSIEAVDGVQLVLSHTEADSGQPISVKVINKSPSSIATFDHKSLCSIFFIQKQVENGWENVLECQLRKPTVLVSISPGESQELEFNGGSHFLDPDGLETGTYRVEFSYKEAPKIEDLLSDELPWVTMYSPNFKVG